MLTLLRLQLKKLKNAKNEPWLLSCLAFCPLIILVITVKAMDAMTLDQMDTIRSIINVTS